VTEDLELSGLEHLGSGTIDPELAKLTAHVVRQEIRQEIHEHWSDIPDADALLKLEDASPGAIDRVLSHMDREQEHRHAMNRRAADHDDDRLVQLARLHARGQTMMFVLALVALLGGVVLASLGHAGYGFAAIVVALGGLTLAFVWGRGGSDSDISADGGGAGRSGPVG
jgi:uncharacterized membrane protein